MSEENKEAKDGEWEINSDCVWIVLILMVYLGWGFPRDTQDHELRERVARLEGQMDMIRR